MKAFESNGPSAARNSEIIDEHRLFVARLQPAIKVGTAAIREPDSFVYPALIALGTFVVPKVRNLKLATRALPP